MESSKSSPGSIFPTIILVTLVSRLFNKTPFKLINLIKIFKIKSLNSLIPYILIS